jgi:GxxExxY protein
MGQGHEQVRRPSEPDAELDQLARDVLDAAFEVHRLLGPGYLESVYEAALGIELRSRGIPFKLQHQFAVRYKNAAVGEGRVDFWSLTDWWWS